MLTKISAGLMLFTVIVFQADASPCTPPTPVGDYLKAHPRWRILSAMDLVSDDQTLWAQYHKSLCHGMARAVLDDSGAESFALALIDKSKGLEEFVVLKAESGKFREIILEKPFVGIGSVVWRSPPGTSEDIYSSGKVRIAHDSIIWEKMEAASQQFYFKNGHFHRLQTSD